MKKFIQAILSSAAVLLILSTVHATFVQDRGKTLSAAERTEVIEKILELLGKNYVFPETAQKMEAFVREKQKNSEYEKITDAAELAIRLTGDLQAVSRDRHLRVSFSPEVLPPDPKNIFEPSKEILEQARRAQSRENFGVARLEVLKGNIGLIEQGALHGAAPGARRDSQENGRRRVETASRNDRRGTRGRSEELQEGDLSAQGIRNGKGD